MPKVSVLMPIYQTPEHFLKEAINSILKQIYTDFEFIILNDSPEDKRLKEIISSYTDERIRYYENPQNLGIPKSYNRLLELANGEYIAMMNHDDISMPDRLYLQVNFLDNHPEIGIVGSGFKKFGEINRFKSIINPQDDAKIRSLLLFKAPLHHPTVMYRRSIVKDYSLRYKEDYISLNDRQLFYDMSKVTKLANLKDVLYKYRFHPKMTSKIFKPEVFMEKCSFHRQWLADYHINLSPKDQYILDHYVTYGRCQIKNMRMLKQVSDILEKINQENTEHHFLPEQEFSHVCAEYLVKRCLNAAMYGKVNSTKLLKQSNLPVTGNLLLSICNLALTWRA